ncbi:hypothetical protein [Azospira oryzae]|uniref:hypothetical protein n=1 Tax=Azospira oryzae TaxID=146939 RepID=UPI00102BE543|nr:hypothetical protein [Azospira oryzae]
MSFKWLNKQGVESDSGFIVQFTGRFTCEYTENGRVLEIEVEDGEKAGRPCINIKHDAFAKWGKLRAFHEATEQEQERLMNNFKAAMAFQGLEVEVF